MKGVRAWQGRPCSDQEIAARIHQLNSPADSAEQGLAQVVLQHADLMADRGLGDVQLFRGAGKALQPGSSFMSDFD
jgi:hypothetical protein